MKRLWVKLSLLYHRSSLTERRGLKHKHIVVGIARSVVVSHRETWIETMMLAQVILTKGVVSHRETWIETVADKLVDTPKSVVSHRETWIET